MRHRFRRRVMQQQIYLTFAVVSTTPLKTEVIVENKEETQREQYSKQYSNTTFRGELERIGQIIDMFLYHERKV